MGLMYNSGLVVKEFQMLSVTQILPIFRAAMTTKGHVYNDNIKNGKSIKIRYGIESDYIAPKAALIAAGFIVKEIETPFIAYVSGSSGGETRLRVTLPNLTA
jgi:hypothetical protein